MQVKVSGRVVLTTQVKKLKAIFNFALTTEPGSRSRSAAGRGVRVVRGIMISSSISASASSSIALMTWASAVEAARWRLAELKASGGCANSACKGMTSMDDMREVERATGVFLLRLEGANESGPLLSGVAGRPLSEELSDVSSRRL